MADCYFFGVKSLLVESKYGDEFVRYKDELIPCNKITDAIEEQIRFDLDIPENEWIDDYTFWSWIETAPDEQIIEFVNDIYKARDVDYSDEI